MSIMAAAPVPSILGIFSLANAIYSTLGILTAAVVIMAYGRRFTREQFREATEEWEAILGRKEIELRQVQAQVKSLEEEQFQLNERVRHAERRYQLQLDKKLSLEEEFDAVNEENKALKRRLERETHGG